MAKRALSRGLVLIGPVQDERGYGFVLYDKAREVETGPPWMAVGARMTLREVDRALTELGHE